MTRIHLNGIALNVLSLTLDYEDVVRMAGKPPGTHLTVTFFCPSSAGTLCAGDGVTLEDGMVISAVDTSSA